MTDLVYYGNLSQERLMSYSAGFVFYLAGPLLISPNFADIYYFTKFYPFINLFLIIIIVLLVLNRMEIKKWILLWFAPLFLISNNYFIERSIAAMPSIVVSLLMGLTFLVYLHPGIKNSYIGLFLGLSILFHPFNGVLFTLFSMSYFIFDIIQSKIRYKKNSTIINKDVLHCKFKEFIFMLLFLFLLLIPWILNLNLKYRTDWYLKYVNFFKFTSKIDFFLFISPLQDFTFSITKYKYLGNSNFFSELVLLAIETCRELLIIVVLSICTPYKRYIKSTKILNLIKWIKIFSIFGILLIFSHLIYRILPNDILGLDTFFNGILYYAYRMRIWELITIPFILLLFIFVQCWLDNSKSSLSKLNLQLVSKYAFLKKNKINLISLLLISLFSAYSIFFVATTHSWYDYPVNEEYIDGINSLQDQLVSDSELSLSIEEMVVGYVEISRISEYLVAKMLISMNTLEIDANLIQNGSYSEFKEFIINNEINFLFLDFSALNGTISEEIYTNIDDFGVIIEDNESVLVLEIISI
ncbi:hypothetical protein [Candidatus Lokiarchaeum ossiferum]|uniref:hypothetical protein n=1 Tax=Candidatus Lokiarchaeum ossiferum TaxID=2951803 RepID=UPI00352E64CD